MSGVGSATGRPPSATRYPALEQMGLVPPPGVDAAYENLLADVLTNGAPKSDRTGTGTRSSPADCATTCAAASHASPRSSWP